MVRNYFKYFLLGFFLLQLCFITPNSAFTGSTNQTTSITQLKAFFLTQNSINITDNNGIASLSSSGNGSVINPFIIEDYVIMNCSSSDTGINIENTNQYVIMRNISVSGCPTAIALTNVTHIQLEKSVINNNTIGLQVFNSSMNSISNNVFQNNVYGCLLSNKSSNNTIRDNMLEKNSIGIYNGIYVINNNTVMNGPTLNLFENNVVDDNLYGFYLIDFPPSMNTYINNTANNNKLGGFVGYAIVNDTYINNTANNNALCGFNFTHSQNNIFNGNKAVNNTQIGFLISQFSRNNDFTRNIAERNNQQGFFFSYTQFDNLNFNNITANGAEGLFFNYSANEVISNSFISQNLVGIRIVNLNFVSLINNTVISNKQDGLIFNTSSYVILNNNTSIGNFWSNYQNYNSTYSSFFNNNFPINVPSEPKYPKFGYAPPGDINITWSPPMSNGGGTITEYRIFRSTTDVNFTLIGQTSSFSFLDNSTQDGVLYYYNIRAVNSAGESKASISAQGYATIGSQTSTPIPPPNNTNPITTTPIQTNSTQTHTNSTEIVPYNYYPLAGGILTIVSVILVSYLLISYRNYSKDEPITEKDSFIDYLKNKFHRKKKEKQRIINPHEMDNALNKIEEILSDSEE